MIRVQGFDDYNLQQQMNKFLQDYKLYMNSDAIDETKKVIAGQIKNARPSLFYWGDMTKKIMDGIEAITNKQLNET